MIMGMDTWILLEMCGYSMEITIEVPSSFPQISHVTLASIKLGTPRTFYGLWG